MHEDCTNPPGSVKWYVIRETELSQTLAMQMPLGVTVLHRSYEGAYRQGKLCSVNVAAECMTYVPGVALVHTGEGDFAFRELGGSGRPILHVGDSEI